MSLNGVLVYCGEVCCVKNLKSDVFVCDRSGVCSLVLHPCVVVDAQ